MPDSKQLWRRGGVFLSGCLGGFVAVMADGLAKGDSSAVKRIANSLATTFRWIPDQTWIAALVVIVLAGLICLIRGMKTADAALAFGAGILSFVMTSTPPQAAPAVNQTGPPGNGAAPGEKPPGNGAIAFRPIAWPAPAPPPDQAAVDLTVEADSGKPIPEVTLEIQDAASRSIEARSVFASSRIRFSLQAGRSFVIYVKAPGYRIAEVLLELTPGETRSLKLTMESWGAPLGVQQLFRGIVDYQKVATVEGAAEVASSLGGQSVMTRQVQVQAGSDRRNGDFVFVFALTRKPQGLHLRLDKIVVRQDGSSGSTKWKFDVFADGLKIIDLPVREYDDGRQPPSPAGAEALLIPAGAAVRIRVLGYRTPKARAGLGPAWPVTQA